MLWKVSYFLHLIDDKTGQNIHVISVSEKKNQGIGNTKDKHAHAYKVNLRNELWDLLLLS